MKLISTHFLLVLFFFFFVSSEIVVSYTTNDTDQLALLAIKDQITSDPSHALASWNHSAHLCNWTGVSCDQHQRVTGLDLASLNLSGTLSPRVGNLSFLTGIRLHHNNLRSVIPNEIGRLFRLQHLDLSYNSFGGEIPLNITNCSSLEWLDLSENRLVGQIPGELGSLSKLYQLELNANNLIGSIPSGLGNLSSLASLAIEKNSLSGTLPIELGSLKRLEEFSVGENQISGTIPSSIFNLSSIQLFGVQENNLSGKLPTKFSLLFPNLVYMSLDSNDLSGEIPIFLTNASRLKILSLSNNKFMGYIPNDWGRCKELLNLDLQHNQLKNRVDKNGESSFLVSLSNNTNLLQLSLQGNRLSGSIPNDIGKLTKLLALELSENLLHGVIPDSIQHLTKLRELDLSGNKITEQIPPTICSITPLWKVYLQNNSIGGTVPACFGGLDNMQYLDLSRNQLSGIIPKGFSNLIHSSLYINLSHNSLHGSLPSMNGNEGYMSFVQYVDVSYNSLSGNIPEYFGTLRNLELLNLSYNNFEGEVPKQGIFSNGDAVILLDHNGKLCGGTPKLHLPACNNHNLTLNEVKKYNILKIVLPVVITVPSIIVALICLHHWKNKKVKPYSTPLETEHPQVSYQELSEATDEFSPFNLIGVGSFGSVYRGLIGPDEETVAIKVFNLSKRGASKSFLAECEALRNIRHRNLVRVVTACSSIDFQGRDFKALVFDYMPNGTLEDWLHPRRDHRHPIRSLNFVERLNIAIDVAAALEYLHHHCQTPIVHCDLKPSNVLLDSDMVAHVGDFGLARLLSEVTTGYSYHSVDSSWIRGSIGYIPPEYGINGKLSILGDVYSYGILLLEMLTGKSPTHGTFKEALSLRQHAKMAMPNQLIDILDPGCIQVKDQMAPQTICGSQENVNAKICECAASMIRLALLCSAESPRDRLQMTQVVKEMHGIRDRLMASRMLGVCIEI